jgi:hypothetical protein
MGVVEWVILAVVLAGVAAALFGWDRYRVGRRRAGDSSSSEPTSEVFIDPASGQRMRVWYNPVTGEREYRSD